MRSSFFEFNVATSALFTAKGGLQVTSHNIANASTKGFSRQVALQRASIPLATYNTKGMVGTGSEIYGIGQIRNIHLDRRYWNEKPTCGEHTSKHMHLTNTELIFNEMSNTGISHNFKYFFDRLQELTTNVADQTYRYNVIQTSSYLTKYINTLAKSLTKQQEDINNELGNLVSTINNLGEQIRKLNEQIRKFELDGSHANDLRDQRALLVDELSNYINIDVSEVDNGKGDKKFSVHINGYEFVNDVDIYKLELKQRSKDQRKNEFDVDGLYDITFENGREFNMYSDGLKGELKSLIDMRDGNNNKTDENRKTTSFKGIPHYIEKLNILVRTMAKAFNEGLDYKGDKIPGMIGHINGYDLKGNKGHTFFSNGEYKDVEKDKPIDYNKFNAFNFQVNSDLIKDPSFLATSDNPTSGQSNNKVILGFVSLKNYQSLFREGKIGDYITGISTELGIDLKQSKSFAENYGEITKSLDNQRLKVSGVSLNEEITIMMQYQQQYQAAAKLINVINNIYDQLINRVGI